MIHKKTVFLLLLITTGLSAKVERKHVIRNNSSIPLLVTIIREVKNCRAKQQWTVQPGEVEIIQRDRCNPAFLRLSFTGYEHMPFTYLYATRQRFPKEGKGALRLPIRTRRKNTKRYWNVTLSGDKSPFSFVLDSQVLPGKLQETFGRKSVKL